MNQQKIKWRRSRNLRRIRVHHFQDSDSRIEDNVLATVIPTTVNFSGDLQQLDETVKSMMETSQNLIQNGKSHERAKICKVCGKEGHITDIKRHIESYHLEGISLPCNLCDKISRSRNGLNQHILKDHGHNAKNSGHRML